MRKLFSGIAALAMVAGLFAFSPAQAAGTTWNLTGSYSLPLTCTSGCSGTYNHTMNITSSNETTGTFSGTGSFDADGSYTWNVNGTASGNAVTFTIVYTGANSGYTLNATGTINPNGSITGTATGPGQTFSFTTTSGAHTIDTSTYTITGGGRISDSKGKPMYTFGIEDGELTVVNHQTSPPCVYHVDTKNMTYTSTTASFTGMTGKAGNKPCPPLNIKFTDNTSGSDTVMIGTSTYNVKDGTFTISKVDTMQLVDTVVVPADSSTPVSSIVTLQSGKTYTLVASGTADAGDGITFDADYSFRTASSTTWTDSVSTYESYTDQLLDLFVNGASVSWDNDAVYNADHTYTYNMTGTGSTVNFMVNDVYSPNNTGSLTVKIYSNN